MSESLGVASFKLQLAEARARIVPERGLDGCAFGGPGIDVVGAATVPLFGKAAPLVDWLRAREPGIQLRSLSVDLRKRRVLLTYAPEGVPTGVKPHVLRIEGAPAEDLLALAAPLVTALAEAARVRMALR